MRYTLFILFFFSLVSPTRGFAAPRRFGVEQRVMLPVLALSTLLLFDASPPQEAHWKGGILFDDSARRSLVFQSKNARNIAAGVGDAVLIGLMTYPVLVDGVFDQWAGHDNADSAAQISLVATQALLMTGFLRLLTKVTVGRERPYAEGCRTDPGYDGDCQSEAARTSFFSGHAALSFTGAGLICAAHESLDLSGGMVPCYVALGLATGVSLTRVFADKHYISDTLVGMVVGLVSGYFVPRWLNYQASEGTSTVVTPTALSNGLGLRIATVF